VRAGNGEYWKEVFAVRTECSKVHTKTTKGQYSPVQLKLAWSVSSLLYMYSTRAMLVVNVPAFETCFRNRFHGNSPYGEVPTKKKPTRMLGFTSRLPCHIIRVLITCFLHNNKEEILSKETADNPCD